MAENLPHVEKNSFKVREGETMSRGPALKPASRVKKTRLVRGKKELVRDKRDNSSEVNTGGQCSVAQEDGLTDELPFKAVDKQKTPPQGLPYVRGAQKEGTGKAFAGTNSRGRGKEESQTKNTKRY